MTRPTLTLAALLVLTPALVPVWPVPASAQPIEIVVNTPKAGATVGREIVVTGTAKLPPGTYLWVFARREDFSPLYWPQREAVIDYTTNAWKATATFGGPQDVDWNFDVYVAAFDAKAHTMLKDYWVKAMASKEWNPIELPKPRAAAPVIRVKKNRH